MLDQGSKGKLPNFTEGDFVLVARESFTTSEKLTLSVAAALVELLRRYVIVSIRSNIYEMAISRMSALPA